MDRVLFLRGSSDVSSQILEIGAGYNPIAPKRGGWQTHVVDHASRDDLCAKYAAAPGVDVGLIEEVDTVWQGGPLHEAVPADLVGAVDTIIASHVLEHFPDLIGFFQSAERLARNAGLLSVAFPDRRYCFDCLRPWSTTGDLLDAHLRRQQRHTLKTAYDHTAYFALADGRLAWGPYPAGAIRLSNGFRDASDLVSRNLAGNAHGYEDYHAWQFSPAGFELALLELRALGLTRWWIERIEGPVNFEFFVHLRQSVGAPVPTPKVLQERRQALLLRQIAETRDQAEFLLGAATKPQQPPGLLSRVFHRGAR